MEHSEPMPRFGRVDSSGRQCMKMQGILSKGVVDTRNMETSMQETQCPSKTTCHTRFSEENQMHLICAPGSSLHTYDRRHE
jgi:hypothetical protein